MHDAPRRFLLEKVEGCFSGCARSKRSKSSDLGTLFDDQTLSGMLKGRLFGVIWSSE